MNKAIAGAAKDEKIYRKIDTKFFNMHFSVPGKSGRLQDRVQAKQAITVFQRLDQLLQKKSLSGQIQCK